jgi:hypothetical protein
MQTFSDPVYHCSSSIGRSLLDWYRVYEDYCCLVAAYNRPLPPTWLNANVQIRQQLAHIEYPRLASIYRQSRLLDDLWPQYWAISNGFTDIQQMIISLETLKGEPRFRVITHIQTGLGRIIKELTGFINSPHVVEVFRPSSTVPILSTNPPPPFVPYVCQFPPAGYLRTVLHASLVFVRYVIYPAFLSKIDHSPVIVGIEEPEPDFHCVEICRSFAGMEYTFANNPVLLFPCWPAMVLAATKCPPYLRGWVWSKLIHFENLGDIRVETVKKNIAISWDTPELLDGSYSWETGSHPNPEPIVDVDDDDDDGIISADEQIKLKADPGLMYDDDGLESLTHLRALFWNLDER